MDTTAWREKLRHRSHWLRGRVELLYGLPLKSLYRGELAEAIAFYQGMVLRPLVELLRMRHDPYRYDFDVRYLRYDLPEPARSAFHALWFVADPDDLVVKHSRALSWFREEALTPDIDGLNLD